MLIMPLPIFDAAFITARFISPAAAATLRFRLLARCSPPRHAFFATRLILLISILPSAMFHADYAIFRRCFSSSFNIIAVVAAPTHILPFGFLIMPLMPPLFHYAAILFSSRYFLRFFPPSATLLPPRFAFLSPPFRLLPFDATLVYAYAEYDRYYAYADMAITTLPFT